MRNTQINRRLVRFSAGLVLALAPINNGHASRLNTSIAPSQGEVSQRLAQYMEARRSLGHFNGSVLIVQNGRPLFSMAVGWAEFEHRVPTSMSTRYAVASITKQFTAAAVLQLRDKSRLSLDDSVCDHLSPCPAAWRAIRIRHLLNHTSGILDYEEPRGLGEPAYIAFVTQPDHVEQAIQQAFATPLEFVPGTKFHYSNTGYIVLSRIISRVSGEPYPEYVEKNLLRPAGMSDSLIFRRQVIPNMARGYRMTKLSLMEIAIGQDFEDPTLLEPHVLGDLSGDHGDANLITTAPDLAKWTTALFSGKILSAQSLREMTSAGLDGYGLGVQTGERFGTRRISHAGGLAGFVSWLDYYPEKDTIVVTSSNLEGALIDEVGRDLAAIALGQPYDIPRSQPIIKLPPAQLTNWIGNYAMPDGIASIQSNGRFLVLHSPNGEQGPLLPLSATRFYLPRLGPQFIEAMVEFELLPSRKPLMRLSHNATVVSGSKR